MNPTPDGETYLALFARYGEGFEQAYMQPEDDRYRLLFDQVCRLLVQPSRFNLALPAPFRTTAQAYLDRQPQTLAHMGSAENRHFMLSDLYDYVHLVATMGGSWDQRGR